MMTIPLHIQEVVLVRQSYSADRPGLPRGQYGGASSDGRVAYRAAILGTAMLRWRGRVRLRRQVAAAVGFESGEPL